MPNPPYAKLLVVVNGGAPQTGAIYPSAGASVHLSGESIAFWQQQRFEVYDFPVGFALPAGWSDTGTGVYFYAADPYPPPFVVSPWGKYMLRLTVNRGLNGAGKLDAGLVDASTALSVVSPNALRDLGFLEANQFSPTREWTGDEKANLRVIDTAVGTIVALGAIDVNPTPSTIAKRGTSGQLLSAWVAPAAAGVAAAGFLRVSAAAQTVAAARNAAATHDVTLLSVDGADGVTLGGTYAVSLAYDAPVHRFREPGGQPLLAVDFANNRALLSLDGLLFGDSQSPVVSQVQGTGNGNGADLTVIAQDGGSGGGSTNGGNLVLRGGRLSGPGTKYAGNVAVGDPNGVGLQTGLGDHLLLVCGHGVQEPSVALADIWQLWGKTATGRLRCLRPDGVTVSLDRTTSATAPLVLSTDGAGDYTLSIPAASGGTAGSMSPGDYTKLAGYPSTPSGLTIAESQVAGLTGDLAGKVPTSRLLTTGNGLTVGGSTSADLSADRPLALVLADASLTLSGSGLALSTTIPGVHTFSAAVTMSAALVLSAGLSAALGATYGGTGQSTTTAGDLLYGAAANTWSKLAAGGATQTLHGGAVPSWSAVSLAADVSGTLPLGSGGLGFTTAAQGSIVYASAANVLGSLAVGAAGTVLVGGVSLPSYSPSPSLTGLTLTGSSLSVGGDAHFGAQMGRMGKGGSDATPLSPFAETVSQALLVSANAQLIDVYVKNEGTAITASDTDYASIIIRVRSTANAIIATYTVTTQVSGTGALGNVAAYSVIRFGAQSGITLPVAYASSNYILTFEITKTGVTGVTVGSLEVYFRYIS